MESNIDLSIIIVNYYSSKLIKNCVNSIINKTNNISYEIIIVDNNTEKEEILLLESEYEDVCIKVVFLDTNLGFGRANNEGLKVAAGRNIIFLNPDTLLLNDALSIMSLYLDAHSDVAICGGNLYDINLNPTRSYRRCFPSILWLIGNIFLSRYYEIILYGRNRCYNTTNKYLSVSYIVGADLMIKAELVNMYGAFDPHFFMYYEEIELCYRIKKKGYHVKSIPHAKIQHLEGKTSNDSARKAKMMCESSLTYYRLTHSHIYYFVARLVLSFLTIIRIFQFYVLRNKSGLAFWKNHFYYLFSIK